MYSTLQRTFALQRLFVSHTSPIFLPFYTDFPNFLVKHQTLKNAIQNAEIT